MNPIECIEKFVTDGEIAGAALLVRQNDEIAFETVAGCTDIEMKTPVTGDTLFRLASMTKPIIGVAIMMLNEQGKLSLDDPVEKFIPTYKDMLVVDAPPNTNPFAAPEGDPLANMKLISADKSITIGMLLSHSSGMTQGPVGSYLFEQIPCFESLEKRVNQLAHIPLDFQPGTGTGYSAGSAFDTLGRIIEVASDNDLNMYMINHLFAPLGIKDIAFLPDETQSARISKVYDYTNEKKLCEADYKGMLFKVDARNHGYFSGSGGMFGSLNSSDRFVRMLARGGELDGVRILKEETVKLMATSYGSRQPMPGMDWGLSVAVFEGIGKFRWLGKGSFGWSGALGTHFYVDPENKISVTLMLNRNNLQGALSHISLAIEQAVYKSLVNANADVAKMPWL